MTVKIINLSQAGSNSRPQAPKNPLNPLSAAVRQFIYQELQTGLRDVTVTSLILTGGEQHFSAGADLTEFASLSSSLSSSSSSSSSSILTLIDVVQALEDSPKPIVAAIAGTCLGGGLELALACHYRVAWQSKTTQLGLPEVHVGVIPGAGGTQRLPKAVGLATACQMILTGAPLSAKAAFKAKLVDDVVSQPDELMDKARKWALWAQVMPIDDRRLGRQSLSESAPVAHNILAQAELALPRQGNQGLQAALRALRASYLPLEQGMKVEQQAFYETLLSPQGKARRHAFFAVRQAQKLVYAQHASAAKQHPLVVKSTTTTNTTLPVAVIGAGTMGTGIAIVLLQAGFQVTLVDVQEAALQKGLSLVQKSLESQVRRKKLRPAVAESMRQRLSSTTRLEDLKECKLVVEAVVENMHVKQSIFRTLDRVTAPSCLLLSNTSTLDIDGMASVLQPARQAWFMGWHFFSPANIMKLVEIVVGSKTCPEAVTLLQLLSKKVGKIGVVVGNCDGFCGNRLLRPYSLESGYVLEEGSATIAQVDQAIAEFGCALGPFQMGDLAGNDVGYNIRRERGWTVDPQTSPPQVPTNRPARYSNVADLMVTKLGRVGQKAGKGWYDYNPNIGKGRTPLHSLEMEQLIQSQMVQNGIQSTSTLSAEEIVRRCFFPMVNEGFKCLEEGIALRPSDIDVVYLYGYGWPAWRGGPMHWADHQVGLSTILSWLERMSRQSPASDHFVPSALLVECVRQGVTVEEYYQQKEKGTAARSKL